MRQPAQRLPHVTPAQLATVGTLLQFLQRMSPRLAARAAFWLFLRTQRRELARSDTAFVATAKLHRIVSGADHVQVYEWGTAGRTALIVHGWGSRAARFAPLAAALVARGWRVLAVDAPGHGISPGRSSSLPQFIAAMDAVAARLGPVHALIGHSLGALAVVSARADGAPAWFGALQKVVLISTPSGAPFLIHTFHRMFGIGEAASAHMQGYFRQRFGTDPGFFTARPDVAISRLPALLLHDRNDDIVPFAHSEELLPLLANARLHATQGLGHSALTRDAATIQGIAGFLEEVVA
jgi:pimeloyl-ACP methyl ester carboxylesterase